MIWYFAALAAIAFVWGRLERMNQAVTAGLYNRSLGYEGTAKFVAIGQGIASLILFAMMIAAFFLFGWKAGLGAVFAAFAVGAISS